MNKGKAQRGGQAAPSIVTEQHPDFSRVPDELLDFDPQPQSKTEIREQVDVAARLQTAVEREYGPVARMGLARDGRVLVDLKDGRRIELSWAEANELCRKQETPDPEVLDRLRRRNLRWAQRAEQVNGPSPHYTAVRRAMTPCHSRNRQSRPGPVRSRGSKRTGCQQLTATRAGPEDPDDDAPGGAGPDSEVVSLIAPWPSPVGGRVNSAMRQFLRERGLWR